MSSHRSTRSGALGLAALGVMGSAVGCRTWDDFTALEATASVSKVAVDGGGGPRFGDVLVGYEVPVRRGSYVRGTRLYVGGFSQRTETVASFATFRIWDELRNASGSTVTTTVEVDRAGARTVPPAMRGCHDADRDPGSVVSNCGSGRRAGAGFAFLRRPDVDWLGCVAVTIGAAGTQERLQVRCETPNPTAPLLMPLENGLGWGASAAGVPIDDSFGVAVFGAPDTDGTGALFRLRHLTSTDAVLGLGQPVDGTARRGAIPIDGLTLAAGDRFGSTVAIGVARDTGRLRIAATLGGGTRRVVVAEVVSVDDTSVQARVIGCLAGGGDDVGFGDALALGDFDGDGVPDLAVGSQPTSSDALALDRRVVVYDGAALGDARTCSATTPASASPAVELGCLSSATSFPSIDCASSRFGHALAAGDFNGDGLTDLAIGAPGAGVSRAATGVVQTIAGTAVLTRMGQDGSPRGTIALLDSGQSAAFGTAVAAIPAPFGRADIAASQSGPASTHVFYCSDLAGDTPTSLVPDAGAGGSPDAGVAGTSTVRGCGLVPGESARSMLDPSITPDR